MAPSTTDEQGESACAPSQGRLRRSVLREYFPRLPSSGPETITEYLSDLGNVMVAAAAAWRGRVATASRGRTGSHGVLGGGGKGGGGAQCAVGGRPPRPHIPRGGGGRGARPCRI